MESRQLAALLTTLVSQLSLLILLLSPDNPFHSLSVSSHSLSHSHSQTLFSLLHHFLSTTQTLSFSLLSRKRARTHFPGPDPEPGYHKLARIDSGPDSFRVLFKMEASTFEWLSGLLEPLLECRDPVCLPILNDLSAELRLGIGLFRLSNGSGYLEIAERFKVTERVARFCTKQLCRVLCTNFRFWVGFPNPAELEQVSKNFRDLTGLPNCCGVLGCTRFSIKNCDQESVSAQIVVDSSCRILSVAAGHFDHLKKAKLLESSSLYKDIESEELLNSNPISIDGVEVPQYLVGDRGYPLLPWLITPFGDPMSGSDEERFNAVHGLMSASLRMTVASLKSWGILSKPIEEDFRSSVAYVGACAILHNALLLREDFSGLCYTCEDDVIDDDLGLEHMDCSDSVENSTEGCVIRRALAAKANHLSSS